MANPKGLLIGGLLLFSVGTTLFIISLVLFPTVLQKVSNKAVISNIVVDSSTSSRYNDWIGGASIENSYVQYYYMWNLTNPNEVLNGGKPNYDLVGPVNYKYEWTYKNVSFSEDGNEVTYSQQKFYIYQSENSTVDPETTMITNVNPAFNGLMSQLSIAAQEITNQFHETTIMTAEELLFIVGTGGQMVRFLEYIESPQSNFTKVAYAVNSPKQFTIAFNRLINQIGANSENTYYEAWANSTVSPNLPGNWSGMILGEDSGISLQSTIEIFNVNNNYSLLHSSSDTIDLWLSSCFSGAPNSETNLLTENLKITYDQLDMICNWWFSGFSPIYTDSYLINLCSVQVMSQVAQCQYFTGIPLGYKSLASFKYSQQALELGPIEMAIVSQSNFTINTSKIFTILFTGEYSLTNANNIGLFLNPSNASLWHIGTHDYLIVQQYILTMSETYTKDTILNELYPISGFVAKRTFYQWLWDCSDPLLDFIGQGVDCSLQQNNTIESPSTIYTGKSDSSQTNEYIKYQDYTVVPYWNGSVKVSGVTESGQFAPGQSPDTLTLFEENTLRPINLVYSEESSVQGITTRRYYLQNNSFPANPVFYSTVDGLTNMSCTINPPAPIFVSLWDMYEVPEEISSKVSGQNPSWDLSGVPLDLEPISGNALYYNLKLQINFYIANDPEIYQQGTTLQNVTTDVYYPLFKVGQTGTPSDSTISTLKTQFKDLKILKLAPVIIASIVGGILIIVGAIMTYFGVTKLRKVAGYVIIQ